MVGTAPAAHANSHVANPALPYGPYTCAPSLVWREAAPGDYVCVPPAVRTRNAQDNAAAPSRVQPGGGPYGPDTCKQGYVWRESRPSDHVCVAPPIRGYTRSENENAVYGYADPTGLPANGTAARWEGQLHVWGSGFTANGAVAIWGFYPDTHSYVKGNVPLRSDGSGQLDGFATRNSTPLSYRSMYVLFSDPYTGLVRNAGRVDAANFL